MMSDIILIASTPLHICNAIIIALQTPQKRSHLFFIDRNPDDIYFHTLNSWEGSPFHSIHLFDTDKTNFLSKVRSKRENITKMISIVNQLLPTEVIVGNDRKSENAALITHIREKSTICYMDDGLHSYIEERSHLLQYTFFDSILKHLLYGHSVITPRIIGCSPYIASVYLYKPQLRNACLQQKPAIELHSDHLHQPVVKDWVAQILNSQTHHITTLLKDINGILFLPHPKSLTNKKYKELQHYLNGKKHIAIKPHPRDHTSSKYFPLHTVIPQDISSEILFLSGISCTVYGFSSTALLTAKWLHPALEVISLKFDDQPDTELETVMLKNGIPLVSINNITF
jgi:hypothetical protein